MLHNFINLQIGQIN